MQFFIEVILRSIKPDQELVVWFDNTEVKILSQHVMEHAKLCYKKLKLESVCDYSALRNLHLITV